MPVALLVTARGDARDAVGLFLAGRGWTTLPAAAAPDAALEALRAASPGLVAIDARAGGAVAVACARALRPATSAPVILLNAPADVRAALAGLDVVFAEEPAQVPPAPGVPPPPHAAPPPGGGGTA